jgi:hypothetical protein
MNAVNVVDRHTHAFEDLVWPLAHQKKADLATTSASLRPICDSPSPGGQTKLARLLG